MSECILGITTIDAVAKAGREGEEHALDGLYDTGRVGRGDSMESGGSSWTAIAAVTGATGAVALDEVAPVRTEYDGAFRFDDGLTIHTEISEVIELFPFTSLPLGPGG